MGELGLVSESELRNAEVSELIELRDAVELELKGRRVALQKQLTLLETAPRVRKERSDKGTKKTPRSVSELPPDNFGDDA